MSRIAKLNELLGKAAEIEMHSGITYSGTVTGNYFGEYAGTGKPRRTGGYIFITVGDRRIRLDALDIKAWSINSTKP